MPGIGFSVSDIEAMETEGDRIQLERQEDDRDDSEFDADKVNAAIQRLRELGVWDK